MDRSNIGATGSTTEGLYKGTTASGTQNGNAEAVGRSGTLGLDNWNDETDKAVQSVYLRTSHRTLDQ